MDEKKDKIIIALMQKDIEYIKDSISELKTFMVTYEKDIEEKFDKKYASKLSEKIVYYSTSMVLIAFFASLIKQIIS